MIIFLRLIGNIPGILQRTYTLYSTNLTQYMVLHWRFNKKSIDEIITFLRSENSTEKKCKIYRKSENFYRKLENLHIKNVNFTEMV